MRPEAPVRAGDHVYHRPSEETWVVRRVIGEHLEWFGWPPGQARISDCTRTYACTEDEHQAALSGRIHSEARQQPTLPHYLFTWPMDGQDRPARFSNGTEQPGVYVDMGEEGERFLPVAVLASPGLSRIKLLERENHRLAELLRDVVTAGFSRSRKAQAARERARVLIGPFP